MPSSAVLVEIGAIGCSGALTLTRVRRTMHVVPLVGRRGLDQLLKQAGDLDLASELHCRFPPAARPDQSAATLITATRSRASSVLRYSTAYLPSRRGTSVPVTVTIRLGRPRYQWVPISTTSCT